MIIKTNGGISVLSAFVNGFGAAASIVLPMFTEINLSDEDSFYGKAIEDTVNFMRDKFFLTGKYSINIKSNIPQGMGLKSSSAMTLSIVFGILKINNIEIAPDELLKIAAEASIENNTSITGAIDDLSIAYFGGFCFTDNRKNVILSKNKIEEKYIILEIGGEKIKTNEIGNRNFSGYNNYYNEILKLIKNDYIYEAMMLNGLTFSDGEDIPVINKMLSTGAIYAGRSGKGPAIFGIYDNGNSMENSFKELQESGYQVIKSRFNNNGIDILEQ
ncbi:shikimate kinase [Ferroplasma sp.]|uniref:shikimate kinase n=1 Tax=Ferroplasma sp. TaxID=2591003 RepID=UPI00307E3101